MTNRFSVGIPLLAALCLPAQLASVAQDAAAAAGQSWVQPACNDCMHHFPENCAYMTEAPIVALVEGTRSVAADTECEPLTHPNDASWCWSRVAYEFRSARFLRNTADALPGDRFLGSFKYNQNFPSANERKEGVALEAGESYTIFAGPAVADSKPHAQWFITSACTGTR